MKMIKLGDSIIALDQIARVEMHTILKERERCAVVTLKTCSKTKVVITHPQELNQIRGTVKKFLEREDQHYAFGTVVTPIHSGNDFLWISKDEYDRLAEALETWEGCK